MESKLIQPWWLLKFSLFLVSNLRNWVNAEPQVPCYFIFGDSLSDSGNNNNLNTLAKVNYMPYGIDFPRGPTGRFSNGRNMQDAIVELLGFEEYIIPFAKAKGKSILKGVNYASGSAGIRNESGRQLGTCVPFNEQIRNHKTIISRITQILGDDSSAKKLLNQCIYAVQIGSNDYINNYFKPKFYNTSDQYTPEQFAVVLVEQFSKQIKALYNDGARKLALFGIGLIGCTPNAIAVYGTNGSACVEKLNNAAQVFNERLISLVDELNTNLTDAKFTYLNPSGTSTANSLGFTVTNASCCELGSDGELCVPNSEPCANRSGYVFWDGMHTSDAWNEVIATEAYSTQSASQAYPLNIQNLAQLQINNGGKNHRWSVIGENSPNTLYSDSI
ncbi:hypothetical protein DITRI_Ditri10aG0185500 [Diplodiscus trichospermus]